MLSRLRGYQILKDERCKQEALAGLQTTQSALETGLGLKPESFSLCHGLGGNAEVLLHSREILGNECRGNAEVAFQIANWGISTYAEEGDWPCGTARPTPSLMLGLAGIGYYDSSPGSSESGYNVGAGVQYDLSLRFSVEFKAQYHWVDSNPGVEFLTQQVGLRYRF